jgi:hypothetical protein
VPSGEIEEAKVFSYLAFKGLYWDRNLFTLFSPIARTAWNRTATPWGDFFYCETTASELDRGYGIFAASVSEARSYTLQVYLVAPDPRRCLVLGTSGWRAEAAMVVAFVTSEEGAAKQILAAYRAGYPQVPGILAWAARYVPPEEGYRVLQDILRDCQDEEVLQIVADSAGSIGEYGLPILEQLSTNKDPWVKMKVMDACRQSVEYVRPLLQRFVENGDELTRAYAAPVCGAHGVDGLPLLEKLANDESHNVRVAVAKSIRQLGTAALPILEKLCLDNEEEVRLEALKSLRGIKKDVKRKNGG